MDKEVEYIRYDYQVPYPEEEKPVLGINEDQDEPMDLDEDTPGYSFSVEQNDIQQELNSEEMHIGMPTKELSKVCKDEPTIRDDLPANTESYHQNGIGNYEKSYVCEPDEKLSQICTAEPTIQDDLPANPNSYHQNGTGNDEEQPKDHHLNRKCDGGENSDSALSTPNQIPKEIKERKQNKRIRTVLEDEPKPPNKRNTLENCRKPQTSFQGAVKSGTKDKRHRQNKRRQRKIWGSAPSLRNREMHASDCKQHAKVCQYDPAEHSESKKAKVEEYGVDRTQRRDPYRPNKVHSWLYSEMSNYIPQASEEFERFSNFAGVFLNPAEKSQCKHVLDFLKKFEEKGIISIGNYFALQELKMHNIHHHIINILKDPERFYDARKTALNQ